MKSSKRPRKTGRSIAKWVSALVLASTLGVLAAPSVSFAQSDAAPAVATAPETAPAPAAVPASEPAATPVETPKTDDAAPAPKTALDNLSSEVMNILIPAFVTFIGLLVTFLLNWIRKKFKLNVSDTQMDAWSKLAEKAADRAGEWARNKVKNATDDVTVPGPEVLEVAVNWAVEMGKSFKLPEMGREKLEGLIEGHLFKKRLTEAPEA